MNKKAAALSFKLAFFAIIVFSLIIIAVGTIIVDWNQKYDSGLEYDLGNLNELDSVSNTARTQKGNISVRSSDTGIDFEGTSIRGAFGILSNIYKSFDVVFGNDEMLDSVTERLFLPDWVRHGIIAMMIIAITLTLIGIFFGRSIIR